MFPRETSEEKGVEEEREKDEYGLNKREQGDGHEEPAELIVDVTDVPGKSFVLPNSQWDGGTAPALFYPSLSSFSSLPL